MASYSPISYFFYMQPIILSKSRLVKYFDAADLPVCLGGNIAYEHDRWINNHIVSKDLLLKD